MARKGAQQAKFHGGSLTPAPKEVLQTVLVTSHWGTMELENVSLSPSSAVTFNSTFACTQAAVLGVSAIIRHTCWLLARVYKNSKKIHKNRAEVLTLFTIKSLTYPVSHSF
jgi:lipid A disaccharide synthetase